MLRAFSKSGATAAAPRGGAGTTDLETYDLYLRGLHFLHRRGGGVARSIDYFNKALAKDSSFARAWAQLGPAYALLPFYSLALRPDVESGRGMSNPTNVDAGNAAPSRFAQWPVPQPTSAARTPDVNVSTRPGAFGR